MIVTENNPVAEWLCGLLRPPDEASGRRTLSQPTPDDWNTLIEFARRHGVLPLLHARLKARSQQIEIPAAIVQHTHQAYLQNAARNVRLYHQLAEILTALQIAQIAVIPLKGAFFGEIVYNNIALRPMADLDILVPKHELGRAVEVLYALGYKPYRQFWIDAECACWSHLPEFFRADAAAVEIHWTLIYPTSPFTFDLDGIWERARPTIIAGVKVLDLAPEDTFIFLCLHTLYKHRLTNGMQAFCDIAGLLLYYQTELNWNDVQMRAREWKADKCVALMIHLMGTIGQIPLPQEALYATHTEDIDPRFLRWGHAQIFGAAQPVTPLSANLTQVWQGRGLCRRITLLLQRAFPSRAFLSTLYGISPDSLWLYWYYLIRPFDLLRQYGPSLWRLLCRDKRMTASAENIAIGNTVIEWMST